MFVNFEKIIKYSKTFFLNVQIIISVWMQNKLIPNFNTKSKIYLK